MIKTVSKELFLPILAMAFIVLVSNILVQFLLGDWLTWGALTYPFAFLVTDLTNRFFGKTSARTVVIFGFALGVVCSFIGTQIDGEFGPLVSFRVATASGIAFISSQLIDISIFDKLRDQNWWKAPLISSFFGSTLDTVLFFSIAFSASFTFLDPVNDISWATESAPILGLFGSAPLWLSLAIADLMVKVSLISLSLVPFKLFLDWRNGFLDSI